MTIPYCYYCHETLEVDYQRIALHPDGHILTCCDLCATLANKMGHDAYVAHARKVVAYQDALATKE